MESAILLKDILPIDKPREYKVHFACWNGDVQPLDDWVQDRSNWQRWQEYRPKKDMFNRPYIFSLTDFYHEQDV